MRGKSKQHRIAAATLLLAMVASACSGGQPSPQANETAAKEANNSAVPPAESKQPPVELTILTGNDKGIDYTQTKAVKIIEEKTNTKLKFITASYGDAYENKQNVTLASGEYPDLMTITNNANELKYVENGLLLPLNKYWDKYPNIKSSRSDEIWNVMTHKDGNVYVIPRNAKIGSTVVNHLNLMLMYRKDWLDKGGFKIPTTLEEFIQVADYVSNGDPDGNGKKDTFAMVGAQGKVDNYFSHIFGAFGVQVNYWYDKNGTIINGTVQPETKEALKLLQQMYAKGMIDPEFITDDTNRYLDKARKGTFGSGMMYGHGVDTSNFDNIYLPFKKNNPDGEYLPGTLFKQPGYELMGVNMPSMRGNKRGSILAGTKNPEAALRVMDFIASDEGTKLYNFGVEGETYKIEDGVVKTFATEEQLKEYGVQLYFPHVVNTPDYSKVSKVYQEYIIKWNDSLAKPNATDIYLIPEVGQYDNLLSNYTNEQFAKMMLSQVDIDGSWDAFVAEWNKRGGAKLGEALNKAKK